MAEVYEETSSQRRYMNGQQAYDIVFTTTHNQKNQIKTMKYHFMHMRMAYIKTLEITNIDGAVIRKQCSSTIGEKVI